MGEDQRFDLCVIGAGLVGLAVARGLLDQYPGASLLVIDKEPRIAAHQSSHNSGVVHSGLYYKPGSLKAQLCTEGRDSVYALCRERGVAHAQCGKLVIASRESELPALRELQRRGTANGLTGLEWLDLTGLREIEPAATGVAALYVPQAGVADYPAMARVIADDLVSAGARLELGRAVTRIDHVADGVTIQAGGATFTASRLVNCAGLQSDRIAALAGVESDVRIVPFRGEYYKMDPAGADLVKALIYPVPDPQFPFLGVHFTRRIDGTVEVGPNAVFAFGREHYRDASPDWGDVRDALRTRGFRKLVRRHWWSGAKELMGSRSKRLYARQARRLVPEVQTAHLRTGGAGVRAQAVTPDGSLVDDFVIENVGTTLHVLNAPSPGATASLAIGRHVASLVASPE